MSAGLHRIIFWLGIVLLCGAHMWPRLMPHEGPSPLWFGWLPNDMAYHLVWILCASAWVFYMCGPIWSAEEEEPATGEGSADA